jgi:tetratricopeptide (TPR) repeat protein
MLTTRSRIGGLAAAFLLTTIGPVWAGDDQAMARLQEAYGHWNDENPATCLRLAEQALEAGPDSRVLRMQIVLFIGSVHHVKTGDLDQAMRRYNQVINALPGVTEPELRQIKADAMVRKGNIIYSDYPDDEDHNAAIRRRRDALRLYRTAHSAFPLSTTADTVAQLCYRQARDERAGNNAENLELSVALAREALELAERQFGSNAERLANHVAKVNLQLAISLYAQDNADEAERVFRAIPAAHLTEASYYQQGIWHVLHAREGEAIEALQAFMDTRPNARTRNQLRKFIRDEPDFTAHIDDAAWANLVQDEPEED